MPTLLLSVSLMVNTINCAGLYSVSTDTIRVLNTKGGHLHYSKEHLKSVEEVEKLGGRIGMGYYHTELCRYGTVDFAKVNVEPKDLECLEHYPCISKLDLSDTRVDGSVIEYIRPFRQLLVELRLDRTKISTEEIQRLKHFVGLRKLSLAGTKAEIDKLPFLKGISEIDLSNVNLVDDDLRTFQDSRISSLILSNTSLTDTGLKHLESCSNLWELVADNTKITDTGIIELLKSSPLIGKLSIAKTSITSKVFQFHSARIIRHLNISTTKIDDTACSHIAKMTMLQELNLSYTKVTLAGVRKLTNKELRLLDLRGTQVVPDGENRIRVLRSLHRQFPEADIRY